MIPYLLLFLVIVIAWLVLWINQLKIELKHLRSEVRSYFWNEEQQRSAALSEEELSERFSSLENSSGMDTRELTELSISARRDAIKWRLSSGTWCTNLDT